MRATEFCLCSIDMEGKPCEILRRLVDLRRRVRDPTDEASVHLSDDIVVAQGVPLMIGAYVSVSSTLSSLSYLLAKNQEVQVKKTILIHVSLFYSLTQHVAILSS